MAHAEGAAAAAAEPAVCGDGAGRSVVTQAGSDTASRKRFHGGLSHVSAAGLTEHTLSDQTGRQRYNTQLDFQRGEKRDLNG